ncbi:hypothetical protein Glove_236g100 [Diversispora epigaea]|uniref:Uncharacterized protein n=1 Tax=Diversispora epigaea TaxID=1348612 RepID=A0A397ID52_9GLOM|nr:hypothetical protein Glove_236g100 [Diversispora epigaea]
MKSSRNTYQRGRKMPTGRTNNLEERNIKNEENYEYCVPSTILCYKALYNNERIVREEKEKELKEYDDLFKVYQKQEEKKQDEIIIKDQNTFEEILVEFDKIINPKLVINPEIVY